MDIMRRPTMASIRGAAAAIAMTCALIVFSAPAFANDSAAILAANAQFYTALNKIFTGDTAAMKAIWSHADDVTYMGPTGGFEHGWTAVLKNWEGQAALKLGGRVEPIDVTLVAGKDVAIVSAFEQGENTNAKGKVERVKLRATNVFRKESGHWKMVAHHTDPLPYLAK